MRWQLNWRHRLQVADPTSMAISKLFNAGQLFSYLERTKISKAGCKWLSKANWK